MFWFGDIFWAINEEHMKSGNWLNGKGEAGQDRKHTKLWPNVASRWAIRSQIFGPSDRKFSSCHGGQPPWTRTCMRVSSATNRNKKIYKPTTSLD